MPTGTFTRKIQCHEKSPVSTPPSSTPTAPPPDITKPKTPIALARSPGSVNSPMIRASATAETLAPASPCTARPTTRNDALGARPQTAEAIVKDDHAAEEDPLVAEQVAEPAREQQEAAEGEQVGVDHPGQRGLREAEVGADRGQRDVHDALVEHDHQVAEAEHVEREPAASGRRVGGGSGGHLVLLGPGGLVTYSTNGRARIRQTRANLSDSSVVAALWLGSLACGGGRSGWLSCCSASGVAGGYAVADRDQRRSRARARPSSRCRPCHRPCPTSRRTRAIRPDPDRPPRSSPTIGHPTRGPAAAPARAPAVVGAASRTAGGSTAPNTRHSGTSPTAEATRQHLRAAHHDPSSAANVSIAAAKGSRIAALEAAEDDGNLTTSRSPPRPTTR